MDSHQRWSLGCSLRALVMPQLFPPWPPPNSPENWGQSSFSLVSQFGIEGLTVPPFPSLSTAIWFPSLWRFLALQSHLLPPSSESSASQLRLGPGLLSSFSRAVSPSRIPVLSSFHPGQSSTKIFLILELLPQKSPLPKPHLSHLHISVHLIYLKCVQVIEFSIHKLS